MSKPSERAAGVASAIKAPTTNLTIGSAGAGVVAFVLTFWDQAFETIFGKNASEATRQWIVLALIGAFAAIAVADLIARAIATAAHERAWSRVASAAVSQSGVAAVVPAQSAKSTNGVDRDGLVAVAERTRKGSKQFLLVKADAEPAWVDANDVSFERV